MYLLKELTELDKNIGSFVLRSIIHSTIYAVNIVSQHPKELSTIGSQCCEIFEKLVSLITTFPSVGTELASSLPFLALNLTNLCSKEVAEAGLVRRLIVILETIVCMPKDDMNQFALITAVAELDSFPDNKKFSKLNGHLKEEKAKQPSLSVENVSEKLISLFLFFC